MLFICGPPASGTLLDACPSMVAIRDGWEINRYCHVHGLVKNNLRANGLKKVLVS